MLKRFQQQSHLAARTAAELDELRVATDETRDFRCTLGENAHLRARQVIFRKLANLLEQGRAALVIEKAAGNRFVSARERTQHGIAEAFFRRSEIVKGRERATPSHDTSSASLTPLITQRAAAGKKLR